MLSLSRVGFFISGETRADSQCEGKEPSENDNLTTDGATRISMQSFTNLAGIWCKSEDLHGANRTTQHPIIGDAS